MPDYKKMYHLLFNAVTTTIDDLQIAQRKCEDTYIESEDTPLVVLPKTIDEKPEDIE